MPTFGSRSEAELANVHPKLVAVCREAIQGYDFTVVQGHRSVAEQKRLYAQGRTAPGKIVTHIDGVRKKSYHNHDPALAVDIAPWINGDIEWNDIGEFHKMATHVLAAASKLGVVVEWGGHWRTLKDYPHFQLVL